MKALSKETPANLEHDIDLDLEQASFFNDMICNLADTLEDVVGLSEAEGFISLVGMRIGRDLNAAYLAALKSDSLTKEQVAQVLVDLKDRIEGGFSIVSIDEDKIVMTNTACPFGQKVEGRPSLCMMTTSVFGHISSSNLGYARVEIPESIGMGDAGCSVIIHLKPESLGTQKGREFYGERNAG